MQTILKYSFWIWIAVGLFSLTFFLKPTDLAASDLGRHLMNGKEILAGHWGVLTTNYYSYTTPDFHFVNHHWLFGVMSYLLYKVGGFSLITIVFAVLYTLAPMILSLWWLPKTRDKWLVAAGSLLIALPMLHSRIESRPEAVSAIFLALSPFLWRWWMEAQSTKRLLMVSAAFALMMVLWVNTHIFWIFAPLVGGGYLVEALLARDWRQAGKVVVLGLILLAACFVSPLGVQTLLYPFGIFTNYAYPVAENQTLFFWLQHYPSARWWHEITFITAFGSLLALFWKQIPKPLRPLIYGVAFLLFCNLLMVRIASFAGLLIIPLITWFLSLVSEGLHFLQKKYSLTPQSPAVAMAGSLMLVIGIALCTITPLYNPFSYTVGLGLAPGVEKAAEFLQQPEIVNKIIFNNYDVGGYLIWYQPRSQYVYFDNRPEAYPQDFVEEEAITAQIDDTAWNDVVAKRGIELIVFNKNDQTDWGRPFLIKRLQDENWAPIYLDDYILILLKNTEENKPFIEKNKVQVF